MPASNPTRTRVPSVGCGYVVCLLLGLAGLGLIYLAQDHWAEGRRAEGGVAGGIGGALCAGALALIAPMQRAVREAKERVRREEAKPHEPWTWDPRWTAPAGIAQAGRRHGRTLLVFAVAALVLSAPAVLAFEAELQRGNRLIWLALVFPTVGVGLLLVAANDAWRRRKYGMARFVPAEVPVRFAGEVAGMVVVSRPVVATGPGRVSVDCWATQVVRSGGKRSQREEVIAHTEREIVVGDWALAAGEARLWVQLPLRGGQPTTMVRAEADAPAFEWRLRVDTPTAGADFVAEFVLPVFAVEHAGPETREGLAGDPPTGARTQSDRVEIFRAAGIREEAQPGAVGERALVLPAGQGRALATAPLVMTVVFGAIAVVLWISPVPGIIAGFVGLFALLPALAAKSLWSGGGERVWVERDAICVQRGIGAERRVPRSELLRIESNKNVGVGTQQFYRVVARLRPKAERRLPGRAEIASMIRGDEATAETIAWLEERVTRG